MKTLKLDYNHIFYGSLILVNKEHPIASDYSDYSSSLVSLEGEEREVLLDYTAAKRLSKLAAELDYKNRITPVSGYRTKKEQEEIYKEFLRKKGSLFTSRYVAPPGKSEHETGLAIDLSIASSFFSTLAGFKSALAQYGFVERYPKGKEKITGIFHQSRHFRYVGYPHSLIMNQKRFTLEEYNFYLKTYPYKGKHLKFYDSGYCYEIFYVKAKDSFTTLNLPDSAFYHLSGNNEDGFIITLCKSDLL